MGRNEGDTNPPRGALVFWNTGAGRAGHIALSAGNGMVYTNDYDGKGKISLVPLNQITRGWNAQYLGWAPPTFPADLGNRPRDWDPTAGVSATGGQDETREMRYNPNGSGETWLFKFLYAHGLRGNTLASAYAIALRESGGDPTKDNAGLNPNGSIDYGLFQINNEAHADKLRARGWTVEDLRDPEKNLEIFMELSRNGRIFEAWGIPNADGSVTGWAAHIRANQPANWAKFNSAYQENLKKVQGIAKKLGVNVGKAKQTKYQATIDPNSPITYQTGGTGSYSSPGIDSLSRDELAERYGFAEDVIMKNKELRSLFEKAVSEQWTQAEWTAQLRDTKWYSEHSAYWRETWTAEQLGGKDWETKLQTARQAVQLEAAQWGIELDEGELDKIARKYLYQGWDRPGREGLLKKHMADEIGEDGTLGGQAADYEKAWRNLADANGLTLDDGFFIEGARQVYTGSKTAADYEKMIREQAASLYPVFADKIRAGMNVADLASGYTNTAKQLLELDDVKLTDPLIQEALGGVDPKSGTPSAMGLWDFKKRVKRDERWQYTQNAHSATSGLADQVLRVFGFGV
jgi:hypothetical protein